MSDPVSLTEAKLFLRVSHAAEDTLISTFLEAAKAKLEAIVGQALSDASPAPLRLCLLYLLAQAYQHRGEIADDLEALEGWLAPYRKLKL